MPGLLVLNGGDEFKPGNEEQDRMLAHAAGRGPAFVVPTAAARQGPQQAVANATAWFERFDLELRELPVLKRTDANARELADQARSGGFFYLVGGDPGLVVQVLAGTRVWTDVLAVAKKMIMKKPEPANAAAESQYRCDSANTPSMMQKPYSPP